MKIKQCIKSGIEEVRKPGNLFLLSLAAVVLSMLTIKHWMDRADVLNNPIESTAEIIRVKPCYKNGKCIDFKYSYEGMVLVEDASVSWAFAKWCEKRNGCRGMTFKILIEEGNPDNILVYWEDMFIRAKDSLKTDVKRPY